MATITTDTFLDGGTARTSAETWTINNGAALKIRTDTRVHANAPASMTGVLGALNISGTDGGSVIIDGTNVRWLAYDTGTGNVPAIGTSITQGGVSGYLLGVWADYTSAPTATGAAMPASGFIKLREVTSGPYTTGALTGIGASATAADVTGWIEVVMQQSTTVNSSSLKSYCTITGDWFYLDNTTGVAGQTIQLPTNGGGTGTTVTGVQIETGVGTGVYEWYDAINSTYWTTSYLNTDIRNKRVESVAGGLIRIGATSGAVNLGYLPASGLRVRVPNIFLRASASGAASANVIPNATVTTRPQIAMSGIVNIDKASIDWYLKFDAAIAKSITISNSSTDKFLLAQSTTVTLDDVIFAQASANATNTPFTVTDCILSLNKTSIWNNGSSGPAYIRCTGTLTDCNSGIITTTAGGNSINTFTSCYNMQITRYGCVSGGLNLSSCNGITLTDTDYVSRTVGDTTSSGSTYAISFSGNNITIDGLTFGKGGAINNSQPYTGVFRGDGGIGPFKIRNIGTETAPLGVGASSTLYPQYIVQLGASTYNLSVQRVFIGGWRSSFITNVSGLYQFGRFENIGLYESVTFGTPLLDSTMHGIISATTGGASAGTNWRDYYATSTNSGTVFLTANVPTTLSSPYITLSTAASAIAGFEATTVKLPTSGDYAIFEMPSITKGHGSFKNVAPTFVATGSHTYQYQIDTGSGWNGTWTTLNATNLSAETISASTGFKLKIKVIAASTSTSNLFTSVSIPTNASSTDRANQYPLDVVSLGFTGLQTGSEVRVYTGTDPATSVEIGGVESTAGSTFSFTHSSGGVDGVIAIFAMGYQPIYLPYTFKSVDDSILIQQVVDRNYVNP